MEINWNPFVVSSDQGTVALHNIHWSKSFLGGIFSCFFVSVSIIHRIWIVDSPSQMFLSIKIFSFIKLVVHDWIRPALQTKDSDPYPLTKRRTELGALKVLSDPSVTYIISYRGRGQEGNLPFPWNWSANQIFNRCLTLFLD